MVIVAVMGVMLLLQLRTTMTLRTTTDATQKNEM